MDWVICNKCACDNKQRKLKITSCSHIFCETCLVPDNLCVICKIPIKSLDIGPGLPKNVVNMFRDPKDIATDIHNKLTNVLRFQKQQRELSQMREKKKMQQRKAYIEKHTKKLNEMKGQQEKIEKVVENTEKKVKEKEDEIAKLEKLIEKTSKAIESIEISANYEDFLGSSTPSVSACPSVASSCGSRSEQDPFDFGQMGVLDNLERQSSTSSTSSVPSFPVEEPLF